MTDANKNRNFRLGRYGALLDARAKRDAVKPPVIVRRALHAYLGDTGQPAGSAEQIERLTESLASFRMEMARVGGNLNQLAHAFNMEKPLDSDELARTHGELQEQFADITDLLQELRNVLRIE